MRSLRLQTSISRGNNTVFENRHLWTFGGQTPKKKNATLRGPIDVHLLMQQLVNVTLQNQNYYYTLFGFQDYNCGIINGQMLG